MANLFKQQISRYVDEQGRQCRKSTPGARVKRGTSKKWYGKIKKTPLASLVRLSADIDRRHDRRSLTDDEFVRLIDAAENGAVIEGVVGRDRALLYILAAWTGFRRKELASLTLKSFDLEAEIPCLKVEAAYSKRRKPESLPLHVTVVARLKVWLASRNLSANDPLFELRQSKGHWRKTAKMMRKDLEAARKKWLSESRDAQEKAKRKESDFLTYCDANGLFADFHANRHTFITKLGRSGVSLMTAQKLARHSDPRLTANVYNHLEEDEKATAIGKLGGVRSYGEHETDSLVTPIVTPTRVVSCPFVSSPDTDALDAPSPDAAPKSLPDGDFVPLCQLLSSFVEVHLG